MCGIAGIINFDHRPVASSIIKAMTDSIAHRGPDGEGQFIDQCVGLGHRRLAILDLSHAADQPMQTVNKHFVITYNGEVYNFKELRQQLENLGYEFKSNTDTEVVLNAYVEWGSKCVDKFNGMFAFAILDVREKRLFIARDRYGIKPLYYLKNSKHFVFASEIKSIIASELYYSKIDKAGLVEYLTFQNFFSDRTLFQDIKILMPGHYMHIDIDGRCEKNQYWDFKFCGSLSISEQEAIEETDRLFKQAVQRQLISDVPVNAYLSGGIDSGAITLVASKLLAGMRTFTIGFDLSSASGLELAFDERAKAEHVSYLAHTEQYEMVLKAGDMERCMERYIWHLEEPRVGQSYPNYYAAMLASKFGKVILSGIGGDELFGGYPWRYIKDLETRDFDAFISNYYMQWQRLFPQDTLQELIAPLGIDIYDADTNEIFSTVLKQFKNDQFDQEKLLNCSFYLEAKTFLHGLLIVEDKLSMAHGLETRVPFLDNDLVDFACRIPSTLKIDNSSINANENDLTSKRVANKNGKLILRKTLSKYMDKTITEGNKQGFSSPDASWFRGESIDYVKQELKNTLPYLNKDVVQKILDQHISGKENKRLAIWSLLYLHKMQRVFNYEYT